MYNDSAVAHWDANTDSDLAGYKLYVGTLSHVYDGSRTITTTDVVATATGLSNGSQYFFAVTAFDLKGNESTFSAEMSKVMNLPVLGLLRRIA